MNSKSRFALLAMLLLAIVANVFAKDAKETISVRGDIIDSQCAFNVHSKGHSHELMLKSGLQGTGDERTCTLHCVKEMGGKYVLVVKDQVYRLDDQDNAEKFVGVKVKVTGTVDPKTNILHVVKFEPAK